MYRCNIEMLSAQEMSSTLFGPESISVYKYINVSIER